MAAIWFQYHKKIQNKTPLINMSIPARRPTWNDKQICRFYVNIGPITFNQ